MVGPSKVACLVLMLCHDCMHGPYGRGYPEDTASPCWILACRIASGFAADGEGAATDKERLASDSDDKDERQSWAEAGCVWNAACHRDLCHAHAQTPRALNHALSI